MAAALILPAIAGAVPPEDTTRLGIQVGYRWEPNARFSELAALNGYPTSGSSSGGPVVMAIFGYRPMEKIEVAFEVGFSFQSFNFQTGQSMQLTQVPATASVRYVPFGGSGKLFPYVGAGYGYLLNFFSNAPTGVTESHGSSPLVLAGLTYEVGERVSLSLEYRYAYCRVELPGLGFMQVGGSTFTLGISIGFPPEQRRTLKD
jgi:opacity protein-like surface antigen